MLFASRSSASILDLMPLAAEIDSGSMGIVPSFVVQFHRRSKNVVKSDRECRKGSHGVSFWFPDLWNVPKRNAFASPRSSISMKTGFLRLAAHLHYSVREFRKSLSHHRRI